MSRKMKEKPAYNVWQNVCWIVGNLLKTDRLYGLFIVTAVAATVGESVAALFLPRTVVQMVEAQAPMSTLIWTILGFSAVLALTGGLTVLMRDVQIVPRIEQGHLYLSRVFMKNYITDYSNLSRDSYNESMEKACEAFQGDDHAAGGIFPVLQMLAIQVLGFVIYLALLTAVHPMLLALVLFTSVAAFFLRKRTNVWEHDHDRQAADPSRRMRFVDEAFGDIKYAKDIRLFGLMNWLDDIWDANKKLADDFRKQVSVRRLWVDLFDCAVAFLREGLAYGFLIWMVLYREMPADQFVLLFAAIGGFSAYITGILEGYTTLHRFSLELCRLREFLSYPEEFRRDGTKVPGADAYEIQLRDVSFRYPGAAENTLEHINLTIRPGEKLAVVGLNGAGKTTLIQLICGLYDPTEGQVLLNGVDIRTYDRNEYYQQFAAVFQDFSILPYSIAQNVAVAEEEDIDYRRVGRCLELADIADKVNALPEKEHSLLVKSVNANAVQLSGGETQRLMLARALYKDAPILLLDEPTAALDPIAESRLYQHYDALSQGKTAVYISHRLASTFFCDRIILIADKGIAEEGTHAQLMALHGKYADLFQMQSQYYKDHPEGGDEDVR